MDEWFKWVTAGLSAVFSGAIAWTTATIFAHYKEHNRVLADLDKRVTVLQTRPQVDPVEYIKAVTELTGAITTLTRQVTDLTRMAHELKDEIGVMRRSGIGARDEPNRFR